MKHLLFKVSVLIGFISLSQSLRASYVGVLLYRSVINDHIHLVVADDSFAEMHQLNVWNNVARAWTKLPYEVKDANKYLFFKHEMDKKDILHQWQDFFASIENKRSIIGKNCAYASYHVLTNILGIPLVKNYELARLALFIWAPSRSKRLANPDQVYKSLKRLLKKHKQDFIEGGAKKRLSEEGIKKSLTNPLQF